MVHTASHDEGQQKPEISSYEANLSLNSAASSLVELGTLDWLKGIRPANKMARSKTQANALALSGSGEGREEDPLKLYSDEFCQTGAVIRLTRNSTCGPPVRWVATLPSFRKQRGELRSSPLH
jgi:hypothetical protein